MFSAVRVCINIKSRSRVNLGLVIFFFVGIFTLISQLVVSHLIPLVRHQKAGIYINTVCNMNPKILLILTHWEFTFYQCSAAV